MPEKKTMTCVAKTIHDPTAADKLFMIQFRVDGEISTVHLYRNKEAAAAYELGEQYDLTISAKG